MLSSSLYWLSSCFFVLSNLKEDKQTVEAKYLQLACEDCYHMEIINAPEQSLAGKTIIPESGAYDIESLIGKAIAQRQNLCLEGRLYYFNFSNLAGIDPPGYRFEVTKIRPLDECKFD